MSDVPTHDRTGLTETDLGPDPIARVVAWLEGARAAGVRFPEAAALATADADGRPAVRHVLVKSVDERGLTFFTNRESRKGRHLAENPNAAPPPTHTNSPEAWHNASCSPPLSPANPNC